MIQTEDDVFKGPKARSVLLLLDVSGSMNDDNGAKINNLNKAVAGMIEFLKKDSIQTESYYVLGIITFGGNNAEKVLPFTEVSKIKWKPLSADGGTPLGDALKKAKAMIETKEEKAVFGRAWVATVVLVSDGMPNDENWEKRLDAFINDGRSQKCDRWAMGIGSRNSIDEQMLKRFAKPKEKPNDPEKYVLGAAPDIVRFFQRVSDSVKNIGKEIPRKPKLNGGLGGGGTVEKEADDDEQV